ncbi:MAG TPA: hypothetical protein PL133_06710 [Methylophilaceae bacterium]|nr:hypothetical protein [Methylophilaceae bacterium]
MKSAQVAPPQGQLRHRSGFLTESTEIASLCPSEERTAVLTLDENGTIFDCNQAAAKLIDCVPSRLKWKHISKVIPEFAETALVQGGIVNPNLRFLSHIGYQFELVGLNGVHIACALFFNEVEDFGRHCLRMIIRPVAEDSQFA